MDLAKKQLVLKIVMCILLVGAVVSLIGVITTASQYSKSKKEYAKLETYVTVETPKENVVSVEPIPDEDTEEATDETVEEPVQKLINIDFDMDINALKEINSDIVGWLYYEPIDLSYPVVMDNGDDYYEHYSFEKVKNVAGAIFVDYLCRADLRSFNTVIYGHNMRNGTMFGSLNNVLDKPSIIEKNPYFYMFTENEALMYKIVSGYYTTNQSDTYNLLSLDYTDEDKQKYVDYMKKVSTYKDEEFFNSEITEDTKLCTLSTCHGVNSTSRTVLHGVLVAREER